MRIIDIPVELIPTVDYLERRYSYLTDSAKLPVWQLATELLISEGEARILARQYFNKAHVTVHTEIAKDAFLNIVIRELCRTCKEC